MLVTIDETSGILNISFLHTNPKIAYEIIKQLIKDSNQKINSYNKTIAQKQLSFTQKQVQQNKEILNSSIEKLKKFQDKYALLDPSQTAQTNFAIVANLKSLIIEKKAKLNQLLTYMNPDNFEIKRLKSEISQTQVTLNKMKKTLASKSNKEALNAYIFEYERLKSVIELNKELYKQSLLQLEQLKQEINKNSKMLLVLTKPFIPDGYIYPEKLKDIVTILLLLSLIYGIVILIEQIIKEHID